MNRFLPSKKLLVFLVTALVILGCFFLFFKFKDRKISYLTNTTDQEETAQAISQEIQRTLKNDTDGDGLKDWEEVLWETDPNNPDTDGDGTDDNSEVLANRNPLIAGPDDFLDNKVTVNNDTQNNSELSKPLTQTDLLSRELFVGYVALKQNDQLGTVQEEQFINDLVTKNLSAPTVANKEYKLSDLNIIKNDSVEKNQQYANQLDKTLYLEEGTEHDITIAKRAIETKNREELEKIRLNIVKYKRIQNQLLKLEVLNNIAQIHLDIINTFSLIINDTSTILLIFDDPIASLRGIQGYFDNEELLRKKFNEIRLYLSIKGVEI